MRRVRSAGRAGSDPAVALGALDREHVELADQIAEDDRVAGHLIPHTYPVQSEPKRECQRSKPFSRVRCALRSLI